MRNKWLFVLAVAIPFLLNPTLAGATTNGLVEIKLGESGDLSSSLQMLLIVGLLSLAPSFLIMFTCFTHVIIVLSLTRQGLGTQSTPPNQVLVGLALFITIFIMSPIFSEVNELAYQPYQNGEITFLEAIETAEKPIKLFMVENTYDQDLRTFLNFSDDSNPTSPEEVSIWTAVPSYALTQITKGLFTGMMIMAIFAFIDALVGAVLMFMGMIMLPPVMLSLPVKLLVFVYVGGFTQVVEILFQSIIV